jgi:DNA-binding LacI/PurR family transcriptional regulator
MSEGTVRKIEAAIEELGYRPHWAARQLKTGVVPIIGLLVPSVANPSHGAMARAVEVAAEANGFQVALGNPVTPSASFATPPTFRPRHPRIIVASSPFDLSHFNELTERGLRIVALDLGATLNGVEVPVDSASVDNRMAGYLATRHLIDLAHRRIGYISGATLTASRQAPDTRRAGRAGIACDADLIAATPAAFGFDDTNAAEHGKTAALELLGLSDPPSAIVGFNDMHALGACAAARDLGLSVPDDVSVVGIDDILLGSLVQPALTTFTNRPTRSVPAWTFWPPAPRRGGYPRPHHPRSAHRSSSPDHWRKRMIGTSK